MNKTNKKRANSSNSAQTIVERAKREVPGFVELGGVPDDVLYQLKTGSVSRFGYFPKMRKILKVHELAI